jgi:hypothetical protein
MDLREGQFGTHPPVHPDVLEPEVVLAWGCWLAEGQAPGQPQRGQWVDGLIRYLEVQLPNFKPPRSLPVLRSLLE